MEYNFDLKEKVAVVTGAAGILCSVISRGLAKKGVKVALLDINVESAEKIATQINENGGDALALKVNVLEKQKA